MKSILMEVEDSSLIDMLRVIVRNVVHQGLEVTNAMNVEQHMKLLN